jgi:hypothetical protein
LPTVKSGGTAELNRVIATDLAEAAAPAPIARGD